MMPWFRCDVRGENFPSNVDDYGLLLGFYKTLFVEADSDEDAEARGVAVLKADPRLAAPPGHVPSGRARVFLEEITELPAADVPARQPGFVFFPMDDAPPAG
jgi:hypothetical protein